MCTWLVFIYGHWRFQTRARPGIARVKSGQLCLLLHVEIHSGSAARQSPARVTWQLWNHHCLWVSFVEETFLQIALTQFTTPTNNMGMWLETDHMYNLQLAENRLLTGQSYVWQGVVYESRFCRLQKFMTQFASIFFHIRIQKKNTKELKTTTQYMLLWRPQRFPVYVHVYVCSAVFTVFFSPLFWHPATLRIS